jgi:hypothetical protein
MLVYLRDVMIAQKTKIPHVVHLTNQHWMNQSISYRYGSIPQEEKHYYWNSFGVPIAARMARKNCLGQHNFF